MAERSPHPSPGSPVPHDPDDLYAEPPPWDIGRPQSAFPALADAGAIRGRVLDAGCGTGEHALMAFARGWRADSLEPATIEVTTSPEGVRAWLAALTRTGDGEA